MDDGRRHPRRQHLAVFARLHRRHVFVLRAANVALLQLTGCGTDSAAILKYTTAVHMGQLQGTALINFHPSVNMLGCTYCSGYMVNFGWKIVDPMCDMNCN